VDRFVFSDFRSINVYNFGRTISKIRICSRIAWKDCMVSPAYYEWTRVGGVRSYKVFMLVVKWRAVSVEKCNSHSKWMCSVIVFIRKCARIVLSSSVAINFNVRILYNILRTRWFVFFVSWVRRALSPGIVARQTSFVQDARIKFSAAAEGKGKYRNRNPRVNFSPTDRRVYIYI